jgi:hypothetical protein
MGRCFLPAKRVRFKKNVSDIRKLVSDPLAVGARELRDPLCSVTELFVNLGKWRIDGKGAII